MASFNIITEPWIDVVYTNNTQATINLIEAYEKAASIKTIKAVKEFLFTECAVKLFLTAFLCDVLYDNTSGSFDVYEKAELFYNGAFDIDAIRSYIENCKENGVSFDLFDDDKPFMQTPSSMLNSAKKVPVSNIVPTHPSGTAGIFNYYGDPNGNVEDACILTPQQYFYYLLSHQAFTSTAGGKGYSPSMFLAYKPLFLLPEGRNLFETLLMMIPTWNGGVDNRALPMWRREYAFPKGGPIPGGFLADVFVPTQIYRYGDIDDSGNVKTVFRAGIKHDLGKTEKNAKIKTSTIGKERLSSFPYFLIRTKKNGEKSVLTASSEKKDYFEMVKALISETRTANDATNKSFDIDGYEYNHTSASLNAYLDECIDEKYIAYGVVTDKAKFVLQKKFAIIIPSKISNAADREVFKKFLEFISTEMNNRIYRACVTANYADQGSVNREEHLKKKISTQTAATRSNYFDNALHYYEYAVEQFDKIETEDEKKKWLICAKKHVEKLACDAFKAQVHPIHGHKIDYYKGLRIIMNDSSRHYFEASREKVKSIYSYMLNEMAKDDLYVLKNERNAPTRNSYAYLVANLPEGFSDERECGYEKNYYFATLMAESVLGEKKREKNEKTEYVPFTDFLFSLYRKDEKSGENKTGKQAVEVILSQEEILNPDGMKLVSKMLKRAERKMNIDVVSLCADLDGWKTNNTPIRWATTIAKKIESENEKDS